MPLDVILGGQQFSVDNPNVILGLIDNLARMRTLQETKQGEEVKRNQLLESLAGYNLAPELPSAPRSFEELGSRYRGTTGEYDPGGYPIQRFEAPGRQPQVRNLKQLVEIIQGLKGLPQEYAGGIISRLTGLPDPSQQQAETLVKLRAALSQPQRAEALELKRGQQEATEKYRKEQLEIAREKMTEQRFSRINVLSRAIQQAINPELKKRLSEMYMRELLSLSGEGEAGEQRLGVTPQFSVKWSKK